MSSSWGVSDFFSVDAKTNLSSSQRNGFAQTSSSKCDNFEQNNGTVNHRKEGASSRGVKRKQVSSSSNSSSQDCDKKITSSSISSKFSKKSSFTKTPSFENSSSSTVSSQSCSGALGQLWADKHAPSTADQLSVHAKKIQEVRQWLQSYYSQDGCQRSRVVSPFLLLTGPAGCPFVAHGIWKRPCMFSFLTQKDPTS